MSSGLLRGVLDAFITEDGVMSSRISNAKQLASSILAAATESNDKMQQFDKFACRGATRDITGSRRSGRAI